MLLRVEKQQDLTHKPSTDVWRALFVFSRELRDLIKTTYVRERNPKSYFINTTRSEEAFLRYAYGRGKPTDIRIPTLLRHRSHVIAEALRWDPTCMSGVLSRTCDRICAQSNLRALKARATLTHWWLKNSSDDKKLAHALDHLLDACNDPAIHACAVCELLENMRKAGAAKALVKPNVSRGILYELRRTSRS